MGFNSAFKGLNQLTHTEHSLLSYFGYTVQLTVFGNCFSLLHQVKETDHWRYRLVPSNI